MPSFNVAESNDQPTSSVSGTIAQGAGFQAIGVAFAGQSTGHLASGGGLRGIYGTLQLNADGSFTYRLDNGDPDTDQLASGRLGEERFTYTYTQGGVTRTGTLTFQIAGLDEPGQSVVAVSPQGLALAGDGVVAAIERIVGTAIGITVSGGTLTQTPEIHGSVLVGGAGRSEATGVIAGASGGLINHGRIEAITSEYGHGATGVIGGGVMPIVNNGVIRAFSDAYRIGDYNFLGSARGISSYFHGESIINNGLIEVISTGPAAGIINRGLYSHVTNNGVIYVSGGNVDSAFGVFGISAGQSTGAMIVNHGTIEVVAAEGQHTVGIRVFPDSSNIHSYGTIINHGTIIADTAIIAIEGYEIALTVINTGRIEGDLMLDHGYNLVTNAAGGLWLGTLTLGYHDDWLRNAGAVQGDVRLGGGADLFDGRGGSVSDAVYGEAGMDLLEGGGGSDRLDGGADGDVLIGGGGADQLTGGSGGDVFLYRAASDSTAAAQDLITDFQSGSDRIDLSLLAPTSVTIAQAGGHWIVTAQTAGGELSIRVAGSVTLSDIVTTPASMTQAGSNGADLLIGAGVDAVLNGLGGNDALFGTAGDDRIDGGASGDTMRGGAGNDIYWVDSDSDRPIEAENEGIDEVQTSVDFSLQRHIENGTLLGSADIGLLGNALDNVLTGNAGHNALTGGAGNDILIGDGGSDTLDGGAGTDRFVYRAASDAASQSRPEYLTRFEHGTDIIDLTAIGVTGFDWDVFQNYWTASYYTTVRIHTQDGDMFLRIDGRARPSDFLLANTQHGTAGADILTGGDDGNLFLAGGGNDVMTGGAGADIFDGGAGADRMHGGGGNDSYYVDDAGDLIFEGADQGVDTVHSTISHYLHANVENLALDPEAGDLFGVGNDLANTIQGNAGSNLLIAGAGDDVVRGGAGVDSLFGQDGNDQLFGDAGIDYLVGGAGNDMLDGGADADALYGEDGDDILVGGASWSTDILVGGAGNDTLRGDSGQGDYDLMDGGSGDDLYYVDTPDDLTFEAANGGTDTVYAAINGAGYYLYPNVENLILGGNTPFGVGNELNNRITGSEASNWLLGGAGDDILNGRGGNDVLFGEAGADVFVFAQGTGGDVIGDFTAGTDRIDLSAFGFTSFAQVEAVLGEQDGTSFLTLGNGDKIVLNGVARSALGAGDFILASVMEDKVPVMEELDRGLVAGLVHDFHNPRLFVDYV